MKFKSIVFDFMTRFEFHHHREIIPDSYYRGCVCRQFWKYAANFCHQHTHTHTHIYICLGFSTPFVNNCNDTPESLKKWCQCSVWRSCDLLYSWWSRLIDVGLNDVSLIILKSPFVVSFVISTSLEERMLSVILCFDTMIVQFFVHV